MFLILLTSALTCFPCSSVQQCENLWCCFACKASKVGGDQCFWASYYFSNYWSYQIECCTDPEPRNPACYSGVYIPDAKYFLGHGESYVPQGYQDFYCFYEQYGSYYGGVLYTHMVVICNAIENSGSIQVMDPSDGALVWNRYDWYAFNELIPQ